MAEKTIVDKAGKTVGVGIAMASDVAGAIKTAFGAAVITVTEVLKKAPAKEIAAKKVAQKAPAREPVKKIVTKKFARKASPKKAAKKSVKKPAKKAGRPRK
jgi:hypothetical protein